MARPFASSEVEAAFNAVPAAVHAPLLALRETVFAVADEDPRLGGLVETLKWKQPAYLPARPRVGTTVRIDALGERRYALFVHCQTSLAATYRDLYPGMFAYDGDRGLIFSVDARPPVEPLRHCIALALSYHADRKIRA